MDNKHTYNWSSLESRLGISGLESYITQHIIPELEKIEPTETDSDGTPKRLKVPLNAAFVGCLILFTTLEMLLPDNSIGTTFRFLSFPVLFILCMALMAYTIRARLLNMAIKGKETFIIRTGVLKDIAGRLGLSYSPVPGGPSKALKVVASYKFCPQILRKLVVLMDENSGMEHESGIIRRSGLAAPNVHVLGNKEAQQHYAEQAQDNLQFQDGFRGTRKGLDFCVLEWDESDEDTQIHHLMLCLDLPRPITGRVEFKNKKGRWPQELQGNKLEKVKLISSQFHKTYSVRASDQVEGRFVFDPLVIERLTAFAHDAPLRGAVFDQHMVIDITGGENRFDIVNLVTGHWDDTTIQNTFTDLIEMFDLVDAIGHAFSVKRVRAN